MSAPRRPIPLYVWAGWMALLGAALTVFYGILTPVWMVIRFVAWVSERPAFRRR